MKKITALLVTFFSLFYLQISLADTTAPSFIDITHGLPNDGVISALTLFNGKLYVANGRRGVYVYNGDNNNPNWNSVTKGLQPNLFVAHLTVFNHDLYETGFIELPSSSMSPSVGIYNGNDQAPLWITQALSRGLPQKNSATQIISFNYTMYMLANHQLYAYESDSYDPLYDGQGVSSWKPMEARLSLPANGLNLLQTMVVFHHKIYLGGGGNTNQNTPQPCPVAYVYDGHVWTSITTGLPAGATYLDVFGIFNDKLYVAGEKFPDGSPFVAVYDEKNAQWTDVSGNLPVGVARIGAMGVVNNTLYIAGIDAVTFIDNETGSMGRPVVYQYNSKDLSPSWTSVFPNLPAVNFIDGPNITSIIGNQVYFPVYLPIGNTNFGTHLYAVTLPSAN